MNIRMSIDINVFDNFLFLSMLTAITSIYFTTYSVIQLSKIPIARVSMDIIDI
ncbi:hypothetical protein [Maledivibacter halophilus]|uniref:hypothetical protein n=1 Tax=Maledivibacter halophilus TaxID=36842 RepID=UPI0014826E55|nr:hypothetical protein [Maledivibacter halophilus]